MSSAPLLRRAGASASRAAKATSVSPAASKRPISATSSFLQTPARHLVLQTPSPVAAAKSRCSRCAGLVLLRAASRTPDGLGCPTGSASLPPTWRLSVLRRGFTEHRSRPDGRPISDQERADESTPKPIAKSLDAARERTKAVGAKVRSSLTRLTPHENIYNLPNLLTVSRLFAAPATAYLLLHDQHAWAVALFAYAGITDLVDGWLARRYKLQTVAGSVIDPMADKALMIILTVTLAVKGALPLSLATLILGRDASLALAAIYYRYASLPAPKTFTRYWDFSLPSAEVHPTTVSKYNTLLQLLLIGSTLALPLVPAAALGLADAQLDAGVRAFQLLVAATTAWSGLSYAFLKDAVTILGRDEGLKARQGARGRAIIGVSFGAVVLAAAWLAVRDEEPAADDEAKEPESS